MIRYFKNGHWLISEENKLQIFLLIAYVAYFIIYFQQAYNSEYFILDDTLILGPIFEASSFFEIYQKNFIDIQPVRDFSYWIDKSLMPFLLVNPFKISNIFYYGLACLSLIPLAKKLTQFYKIPVPTYLPYFISLFMLFHPSMSILVTWISARKHLLAFLFILLANNFLFSYLVKEKTKYLILTCLFFTLSLLSHTINCLWPLWVTYLLLFSRNSKKTNSRYILSFILLSLGVLAGLANTIYYKFFLYSRQHLGGINTPFDLDSLYLIPNTFGRYFINLLDFSAVSIYYDNESLGNTIGLFLFIFFLWLLYQRKSASYIKSLTLLLFVSSFTYTFYILGTFAQNTYAPLLYVSIILLTIFMCSSLLNRKFFKFILLLVLGVEIIYSNHYARLWRNNLDVVANFKSKEDHPEQKAWYVLLAVKEKLTNNQFGDSALLETMNIDMLSIKNYISNLIFSNQITAGMVFRAYNAFLFYLTRHETLRPEVKLSIIDSVCDIQVIYCNYFTSLVLYQLKRKVEAEANLDYFLTQVELILDKAVLLPRSSINYRTTDRYSEKNIAYILIHLDSLKSIVTEKNYNFVKRLINKIKDSDNFTLKQELAIQNPQQSLDISEGKKSSFEFEKYLFSSSTNNLQYVE